MGKKNYRVPAVLPSALLIIAVLFSILATRVTATADDDFDGQQILLMVPSAPGGLLDLDARVIARHLPKHLPGRPSVVVQNMPGAGGAIMITNLYKRAQPGVTFGIVGRGQTLISVLEPVEYDLAKMPAIWGASVTGVDLVRGDLLKVKTAKDFLKVDPSAIAIAGRARSDISCIAGVLAMELLGMKGYKTVCAYPGTGPIVAAMQRGEVTFVVSTDASFMGGGAYAEMVEKGIAVPIWQSGLITSDGKIQRSKTLKREIPTFEEVYRQVHGKSPSGVQWEAYRATALGLSMLSRTYIVPPGTSRDRLNVFRQAMSRLTEDRAFVTDWERVFGQELAPTVVPAELAEQLKNDFMKPAPWQEYLRNFVKQK